MIRCEISAHVLCPRIDIVLRDVISSLWYLPPDLCVATCRTIYKPWYIASTWPGRATHWDANHIILTAFTFVNEFILMSRKWRLAKVTRESHFYSYYLPQRVSFGLSLQGFDKTCRFFATCCCWRFMELLDLGYYFWRWRYFRYLMYPLVHWLSALTMLLAHWCNWWFIMSSA